MEEFGVRFSVSDEQRFATLRALYAEIKRDKDAENPRDPEEWVRLVPDEIKGAFSWPPTEQRTHWLESRDSVAIAVSEPSDQLEERWDFYRVFEHIGESDYEILGCELVEVADRKANDPEGLRPPAGRTHRASSRCDQRVHGLPLHVRWIM